MTHTVTHEQYVHAIAALAIARLSVEEQEKARAVKLVYGSGPTGTRGVTFFGSWKRNGGDDAIPFVEVSAFGQESWVQVAGTTLHELGHVLAGPMAAHGAQWNAACQRLGLRRIRAAGTRYCLANFMPDLRNAIAMLPRPNEGEPLRTIASQMGRTKIKVKGCNVGLGSRGGKLTRSGSKMRLFVCECDPPIRARVVADTFDAHCDHCLAAFTRKG